MRGVWRKLQRMGAVCARPRQESCPKVPRRESSFGGSYGRPGRSAATALGPSRSYPGYAVLKRKTLHLAPPEPVEADTMRTIAIPLTLFVAGLIALPTAWAQSYGDKEHGELAKALQGVKMPLERGLTASAKEGKPISAKYEMEDGKLQLSVYTTKKDKFSEVIVDYKTGKVAKTEAITEDEDLAHAKEQSEAMAKAKRSLDAAASEAVKGNKGYRVVAVTPTLKDGHPVADVTLVKGTDWKTVAEKLD